MHAPEAHGDAERVGRTGRGRVLHHGEARLAPRELSRRRWQFIDSGTAAPAPLFRQPFVLIVVVERMGVAAAGRAEFRMEVRVPRPARVQIKVHGAFAQNRRVDFTPSRRRLLDAVAIPVPHRSTELASTGWFLRRPRTRSRPPTRRE